MWRVLLTFVHNLIIKVALIKFLEIFLFCLQRNILIFYITILMCLHDSYAWNACGIFC